MLLPTLLLSLALSGSAHREALVPAPTPTVAHSAAALSDDPQDHFESDETGFPARKHERVETAPATVEVGASLGQMARLFLSLWFGVSLAFGALWAVLGWAMGGKRTLTHQRA